MSERSAEHVIDLRGYVILWLNTSRAPDTSASASFSKTFQEEKYFKIFFILSDSYVQNQSRIAMKSPFYVNDSFQLQSRAGHARLQIKPSGSADENARRREPAFPIISGFPLLHSVCHVTWNVFKKTLHFTRSRAALNKMSAKEETIQAASFGVLEEAVDFMKKAHELMNQQALDLRQERGSFRVSCEEAWSCPLCFHH